MTLSTPRDEIQHPKDPGLFLRTIGKKPTHHSKPRPKNMKSRININRPIQKVKNCRRICKRHRRGPNQRQQPQTHQWKKNPLCDHPSKHWKHQSFLTQHRQHPSDRAEFKKPNHPWDRHPDCAPIHHTPVAQKKLPKGSSHQYCWDQSTSHAIKDNGASYSEPGTREKEIQEVPEHAEWRERCVPERNFHHHPFSKKNLLSTSSFLARPRIHSILLHTAWLLTTFSYIHSSGNDSPRQGSDNFQGF